MTYSTINCFQTFISDVSQISLPKKFTFPFVYEPHEIALIAAKELEEHIVKSNWEHNFYNNRPDLTPVGKMFGVLVVQNKKNEIGYLSAFSGKMGERVLVEPFIPPVFDRLTENSYFFEEQDILNEMNAKVLELENNSTYTSWKELYLNQTEYSEEILLAEKEFIKLSKTKRIELRSKGLTYLELQKLNKQSIKEQLKLKKLKRFWRSRLEFIQQKIKEFEDQIQVLKKNRKSRSNALQKRLFSEYKFLNFNKEWESIWNIFQGTPTNTPPSGAGECCAPKLLQFAYCNNLKPIALAEFWWGISPNSIIRKHKHFYPACKGKCAPILGHMLKGLDVEPNPLLNDKKPLGDIEIIFQDPYILVINKPSGLLSVPGKELKDSVELRLTEKFQAEFVPHLLHRLDMATSGIMIFAKTKRARKHIQKQFLNRTIKKRYVALLDGELIEKEGEIDLPLRVDFENRPYQMVCYDHGKKSRTKYKVIQIKNGKTLVYFYPVTGRTHQLRVHASHTKGLNTPIHGDILYGTKAQRLHLHAEKITFTHPIENKEISFQVKVPF
jgi:tRNA pseudouridine32 synthase/23S rRNA pseudouridine746 synthase